ncbi:MAG: peptidylprolyl isomerase [Xanthobacteraceae bacterium]|nr:peptidylprolyl isomerase [Xanthobacteraceae bacterium]
MNATSILSLFTRLAATACVALTLSVMSQPARAQAVVVMVNGDPVTTFDIEQRSKLIALTTHKTPSRQEVLQELIDDKLKIKEAKKFSIDLSASDVDETYAAMGSRMRLNADQLSKVLEAQGIRPETLKSRLKAETAWSALVRGRFKQSLLVGEKDVQSAASGDAQPADTESFEYRLRPVVLFVARGAAPAVIEQRRKEAEVIRDRVQSCDEAISIFQSLRESAIRDPIAKTSADVPANFREQLDKMQIGHLSPPEVTKQGIEMVALCDRRKTTADTPAKREARDKLFAQKFETKAKSYLTDLRKSAMIEYRSDR